MLRQKTTNSKYYRKRFNLLKMSFKLPIGGGGAVDDSVWSEELWQSVYDDYVRNPEFLTLPNITAGEQKICILHAVFNTSSNFCAFTISGAYTVDWGDGTITNHASGTTAQKNFVWDNIPSSTLTSQGYRQAIITITPQSGQNFTTLSFSIKHNQAGLSNYTTGFLDFKIAGSLVDSFSFGNAQPTAARHTILEEFSYIGTNLTQNFGDFFCNCHSLKRINSLHTSSATSMRSMFALCYTLKTIPLLNAESVAIMNNMFEGCNSLKTIPLLNTVAVTSMLGMFSSCSLLQTIPLLNTSAATNMSTMFSNCQSLKSIPLLNTQSLISMNSIFNNCFTLKTIPLLNTVNVSDMTSAFSFCRSLHIIPAINVNSVINFNNVFNGANSLKKCSFINIRTTISFANCMLSASELVEIFNNLATVTSRTITITGNWGASLLTPAQRAIATGKGWTITG
jgi:hypothetical protein